MKRYMLGVQYAARSVAGTTLTAAPEWSPMRVVGVRGRLTSLFNPSVEYTSCTRVHCKNASQTPTPRASSDNSNSGAASVSVRAAAAVEIVKRSRGSRASPKSGSSSSTTSSTSVTASRGSRSGGGDGSHHNCNDGGGGEGNGGRNNSSSSSSSCSDSTSVVSHKVIGSSRAASHGSKDACIGVAQTSAETATVGAAHSEVQSESSTETDAEVRRASRRKGKELLVHGKKKELDRRMIRKLSTTASSCCNENDSADGAPSACTNSFTETMVAPSTARRSTSSSKATMRIRKKTAESIVSAEEQDSAAAGIHHCSNSSSCVGDGNRKDIAHKGSRTPSSSKNEAGDSFSKTVAPSASGTECDAATATSVTQVHTPLHQRSLTQSRMRDNAVVTGRKLRPSRLYSSEFAYYYSCHYTISKEEMTDEELIAERASITKLFLVSDSVNFLFSTLPGEYRSVHTYLSEVDKAVVPSSDMSHSIARAALAGGKGNPNHNRSSNSVAQHRTRDKHERGDQKDGRGCPESATQDGAKAVDADGRCADTNPVHAVHELFQRVCIEGSANNSVCIHVRDLSQQIPPPYLLYDSPPAAIAGLPSSSSPTASTAAVSTETSESKTITRNRRGGGRRSKLASHTSSSAADTIHSSSKDNNEVQQTVSQTPPWPVLTPTERIYALAAWRRAAAERAHESNTRYDIANQHHTITRLRFHDPHRPDVTVVINAGSEQMIEEVARNMSAPRRRDDPRAMAGAAVDESSNTRSASSSPPARSPGKAPSCSTATSLATTMDEEVMCVHTLEARRWERPFVLTPLLTVLATCVPRRERRLTQPCTEYEFMHGGSAVDAIHSVPGKSQATRQHKQQQRQRRNDNVAAASAAKSSPSATYAESQMATNSATLSSHAQASDASQVDGAGSHYHTFAMSGMSDAEVSALFERRGIPPMPRHCTRVTVIVEHAELSPTDLVSLAEVSQPSSTSVQQIKRWEQGGGSETGARMSHSTPRIYCLVTNGVV